MRNFIQARGGLGNLRRTMRLLVGGRANLLRELENLGHHIGDFAQRKAQVVAQFQAFVDDGRALLHVVHGLAGFALNAADQFADLLGGGGGLLGQLANLVGDDGETKAVFSGAGSFNRGVQREQVGLLGRCRRSPR